MTRVGPQRHRKNIKVTAVLNGLFWNIVQHGSYVFSSFKPYRKFLFIAWLRAMKRMNSSPSSDG